MLNKLVVLNSSKFQLALDVYMYKWVCEISLKRWKLAVRLEFPKETISYENYSNLMVINLMNFRSRAIIFPFINHWVEIINFTYIH